MLSAFLTGLFLGLSLIVAIGAQNAFVIRSGILRNHIFYIALFCAISDSLLIIIGIAGISFFLKDFMNEFSNIIFGFSALWLFSYGLLRIRSALINNYLTVDNNSKSSSLLKAISIVAVFTFVNPHVYLDTMILIGSISQQFLDTNRIYFAIGACTASFIWFFSIAYGAKLLTPIMQKPTHWRNLDLLIALIMFVIAFNLASQGNWV
ncbi:LysE family transporter [Candidatus Pseudothioglobus singularis]|jgi:L-lysine exporter family protein LysE/ArgO|nr:LysE family transporter [Candidatus Pseudothioglobus singularis]